MASPTSIPFKEINQKTRKIPTQPYFMQLGGQPSALPIDINQLRMSRQVMASQIGNAIIQNNFISAPVYPMKASGVGHTGGLTPDPGAVAGTSKFLREDASFATPPIMGGSGGSHAPGYAPDPGSVAGTLRYLREDGSWFQTPDPDDVPRWWQTRFISELDSSGNMVWFNESPITMTRFASVGVVSTGEYFDLFSTNGLMSDFGGFGNSLNNFSFQGIDGAFFSMRTPSNISSIRLWFAIFDAGMGDIATSDGYNDNRIGLRFSTSAGDVNWTANANNASGTNGTFADTGVPVLADTTYHLVIRQPTVGTLTFSVNKSAPVTINTNVPTTFGRIRGSVTALVAASRSCYMNQSEIRMR